MPTGMIGHDDVHGVCVIGAMVPLDKPRSIGRHCRPPSPMEPIGTLLFIVLPFNDNGTTGTARIAVALRPGIIAMGRAFIIPEVMCATPTALALSDAALLAELMGRDVEDA